MEYQSVFKRYEMKYMMTRQQKKTILEAMLQHMSLDKFGHTTIRNIYFDTDTYRLVLRGYLHSQSIPYCRKEQAKQVLRSSENIL